MHNQIRHKQQFVCFGNHVRLLSLISEKLIQRIELHKLNAGVQIDFLSGDNFKDLFHHSVVAAVTVMIGIFNQLAGFIQQTKVNSPGIDTNTAGIGASRGGLADTGNNFGHQLIEIPSERITLLGRAVGKTMHFPQGNLAAGQFRQHYASALGTQIHCNISAFGHVCLLF